MNNILDDLYYGKLSPAGADISKHSQQAAAARRVIEKENALLAVLGGSEKETLEQYVNLQSQLQSAVALDNFKCGFKLGTQLLTEALGVANAKG